MGKGCMVVGCAMLDMGSWMVDLSPEMGTTRGGYGEDTVHGVGRRMLPVEVRGHDGGARDGGRDHCLCVGVEEEIDVRWWPWRWAARE